MNLAAWAERNGVARVTAYRWFRAGLVAAKRGRDAAARLPNNPETGCKSRDH